ATDHRSLEERLQRGSAPQLTGQPDPTRVHSARGDSPVAYGSLRAAAERRTKARDGPGTHIMIGTENGGRSALGTVLRQARYCLCIAREIQRWPREHRFNGADLEAIAASWAVGRVAQRRAAAP